MKKLIKIMKMAIKNKLKKKIIMKLKIKKNKKIKI